MNLVLMDFDGTITRKDTFIEFIRFCKSVFSFYLGFLVLSPIIFAFKLNLIPNWRAKEIVFAYFFKNQKESDLIKAGETFAIEVVPLLIRKKASEVIERHKITNDKIVIVTASFPIWIQPWCNAQGIDLLATNYEVIENKVTGKINGKNCYGDEKVKRIKEVYDLTIYKAIYAFGDSRGDKEMLNIADEKFMKWQKVSS